MKRNLLKRGLALITCAAVCMTSLPNLAFAAETTTGTEFESQAEAPGRDTGPEGSTGGNEKSIRKSGGDEKSAGKSGGNTDSDGVGKSGRNTGADRRRDLE